MSDWPWPDDEPSTGDLRDRLAANRDRLLSYICLCGKPLPQSCGFHPEGEECMCIGTVCGDCLEAALDGADRAMRQRHNEDREQ